MVGAAGSCSISGASLAQTPPELKDVGGLAGGDAKNTANVNKVLADTGVVSRMLRDVMNETYRHASNNWSRREGDDGS